MNVDKEQPEIIILWNKEYQLTHGDVVDLLKKFGDLLPDPLSQRVDLNIYAEKLLQFADIEIAIHENRIIGIIALYANNYQTFTAHIPFIAIDAQYQGNGIGTTMMDYALKLARKRGMKNLWLNVHIENVAGQRFFRSLGLKQLSTKVPKIQMGMEFSDL